MLYALFNKDALIGLFSDLKKCKQMLNGLVNNKFAVLKNLKIVSYYDNSITVIDDNIEKDNIIETFTTENTTESEDNNVSTDKLDKEVQNKIKKTRDKQSKIEYNMNLLKQNKEKIEESKNIYNSDLKLYNQFKKLKETNNVFMIPELFQYKYEVMYKLDLQNNLSWETFNANYIKVNTTNTSYTKLFGDGSCERNLLNISSEEDNKLIV